MACNATTVPILPTIGEEWGGTAESTSLPHALNSTAINCSESKHRKELLFPHWRGRHLRSLPDSMLYKCDHCHSAFSHLVSIFQHWMSKHSNRSKSRKRKYFGICDDCGKLITNKQHRCFSKGSMVKGKQPSLPQCIPLPERFKFIKERLDCDECYYETMDKKSLGRHWCLKHRKFRPIPTRNRPPVRCDDCKRPFARKCVLLGHNKRAHGKIN